MAEELDQISVIGVHCTHGVNRTGYVISSFLKIFNSDIQIEDAIQMFGASRTPHQIQRKNLVEDLVKKDRGYRVKEEKISWKPLASIMSSNKRNISLNFKNSIG